MDGSHGQPTGFHRERGEDRTARQGITLGGRGLGLGAGAVAHAGVPLPIVAETAGIPSLATVVKRIAPSVVNIEGKGRDAAEPGTKRPQAGKGVGFAARDGCGSANSPNLPCCGWAAL
jgi:hypothetical protein